jgi:hypothetical protein
MVTGESKNIIWLWENEKWLVELGGKDSILRWWKEEIITTMSEISDNKKFKKYWFDTTDKEEIQRTIKLLEEIVPDDGTPLKYNHIFSSSLDIIENKMGKKESREWEFSFRPFWLEKFPEATKESQENLQEFSQEIQRILDLHVPAKANKNPERVKDLRSYLKADLKNYWIDSTWISNIRLPRIKKEIEESENKMVTEWNKEGWDVYNRTDWERQKLVLCEMMKILSNFKIEHMVEEYVARKQDEWLNAIEEIVMEEYNIPSHIERVKKRSIFINTEDTVVKNRKTGQIIENAVVVETPVVVENPEKDNNLTTITIELDGKKIDGEIVRKGDDTRIEMIENLWEKFFSASKIREYANMKVFNPEIKIGTYPSGKKVDMYKHDIPS